ncbi:hypothetical protein YC2023_089783 [Brassica napus]
MSLDIDFIFSICAPRHPFPFISITGPIGLIYEVLDLEKLLDLGQNMEEPTLSWPSGKGVAAVTSATWVQLTVGGTIYNAWVPGKEVVLNLGFLVQIWRSKVRSGRSMAMSVEFEDGSSLVVLVSGFLSEVSGQKFSLSGFGFSARRWRVRR